MKHKPQKLIGLYKVNDNHSFITYRNTVKSGEYNRFILDNWDNEGDYLLIENHITERYLWERRNNYEYGTGIEWYKVRGGKYTYKSLEDTVQIAKDFCSRPNRVKGSFKCPSSEINLLKEEDIVDRPLCKCGYPTEVKLSMDKSKIYFSCTLKNVWGDFFSDLQVDTPCDFWQVYTEDREVKTRYEVVKARSRESWILNIPLCNQSQTEKDCISCNKIGYLAIFNSGTRRLCQSCMFNNYESLKEKYDTKCLIKLN